MPFLGWTIWIYLSGIRSWCCAIWLGTDDRERSRLFYAFILVAVIGLVIFILVADGGRCGSPGSDGMTGLLWRWLYSVDTPANALPSLHVANTCLAPLSAALRCAPGEITAPIWAALIVLTDADDEATLRHRHRPVASPWLALAMSSCAHACGSGTSRRVRASAICRRHRRVSAEGCVPSIGARGSLPERRVDGCPENVLDPSGDRRAPCDTIFALQPSGTFRLRHWFHGSWTPLALLLVPTNLALVIAFYAERRGRLRRGRRSNSPRGLPAGQYLHGSASTRSTTGTSGVVP